MKLVLWRDPEGGTLRCFLDECPHRLAPLSEGRVESSGQVRWGPAGASKSGALTGPNRHPGLWRTLVGLGPHGMRNTTQTARGSTGPAAVLRLSRVVVQRGRLGGRDPEPAWLPGGNGEGVRAAAGVVHDVPGTGGARLRVRVRQAGPRGVRGGVREGAAVPAPVGVRGPGGRRHGPGASLRSRLTLQFRHAGGEPGW